MTDFDYFIEISSTAFENIVVLECCGKLLNCKYSRGISIFGFLLFSAITTIYVTFLNQILVFEGWLSFITVLFFIVYGLLFLKGNIMQKCLIPIALFSMILCINLFVTFTFSSLLDIPSEELMSMTGSVRFITLFITKIMFFILTRVFLSAYRSGHFKLQKKELFMNEILMLFTFSVGLTVVEIQVNTGADRLLDNVSLICIIGINILVFYLMKMFSDENEKERRIALLEMQLSEQKAMIKDAANISREIKKTEHDIKHHFLSILGLLEQDHPDEAHDYIKKLLGQYETGFFRYISTDNNAINGILNFKISRCKSKHIDIKIAIGSDFSEFDELDICVLLSNLLDNAIEASLNIQSPKIELFVADQRNYLCIMTRNRIERSVLKENSDLKTTKKDDTLHGLGLYSVSEIVEKYDGIQKIYEKDRYFVVDVWLKRQRYLLKSGSDLTSSYETRQK